MRGPCRCYKCKEKAEIKEREKEKEIEREKERERELQLFNKIYFSSFYSNKENQKILPGQSIKFESDGPNNCFIFRTDDSRFNLTLIGTYEIITNVYTKSPGKLIIKCNELEIPETMMSNNGNYIHGHHLITTQNVNSFISINNYVNSNDNIDIVFDEEFPILSNLIIKKIN